MKQTLSKTKRQVPLIIFLCVFALLGLIYYFIYIPANEHRLDAEHFQWLQNIDENIRTKINEADTMLVGYMKMYGCEALNNKEKTGKKKEPWLQVNEKIAVAGWTTTKYHLRIDTLFGKDQFYIEADSLIKKISFVMCRNDSCVAIQYDFSEFVSPLLPRSIFDHYVIFYEGAYIYEDFHSGLSYKTMDSLLSDRNSKTIASSTIIQQKIGGEEYRMFLQPIIFGDKKLIIAGLHSSSRFDSEKKAIPEGIVSGASIIAFALFLLIPWLRILFMGKYDRLQLNNIFWISLVTKVLVAIFFLMFFGFQSPAIDASVEGSAHFIDSSVGANFKEEVSKADKVLDDFIEIKSHPEFKSYIHIVNLGKDTMRYDSTDGTCLDISKFAPAKHESIAAIKTIIKTFQLTDVNWLLPKDGSVNNNWTTKSISNIQAKYQDRRYFQQIRTNSNLISLEGSTPFSLDQVVSRTTGEFRTVIARNVKDTVVAMAFDLACMKKMVLPLGYSVMIIDSGGLVRYHSQSEKNLNENIFNEFSKLSDDGLKSSIKGRFKFRCTATYYERNFDVWLTPLKNYPYYIVVMRNRTYIDSRNVQTFSFSMSMIFLFLLIAIVDLAVMIFTSSRRSPFKKQFFVTSWLWPRRSSEKEYIQATIYYAIVLASLVCIYVFDERPFIEFFCLLFLTLPVLSLFLNLLFLEKYNRWQPDYKKFKERCLIGLLVLITLYLASAIVILKNKIWLILLYLAIPISLYFIHRFVRERITEKKPADRNGIDDKNTGSDRYIVWYTVMLFTRMIITSGIPAMFFYTSSFNYEQNLMARFKQVSMIQQFARNHLPPESLLSAKNVYGDNADIAFFNTAKLESADTSLDPTDELAADIFNACGRLFGNLTFENDDFYKTKADDGSLSYNNILKRGAASTTFVIAPAGQDRYWSIAADPKKILYQTPGILVGGLFWISFLTMLCLFFFLLLFIIKKVFAKDVLYMGTVDAIDKKLEEAIETAEASKRIIIVTLVDEYINAKNKNDLDIFDFKSLCKSDKDEDFYKAWRAKEWDLKNKGLNTPLYITNFEYGFSDLPLVKRKVFFLEKALTLGQTIIILTTKHPIIISEEMRSIIDNNEAPVKDIATARINYLLGKFTTIIHPVQHVKCPMPFEYKPDSKRILTFHITDETKFTFFLNEIGNSIYLDAYNHPHRISDAVTLKIQAIAHNFYKEIWSSLTENEKFVLYDLAEDGLVNTTNIFSLNLLISRGIIICEDGGLHIFNRSFRNFVVTAIGKEETEKINHKYKENSRWGKLNGLLIFSGIVVLIFLGVTQNLVYTKAIGAITGLGTAVVAVVNILNSVGTKTAKAKANGS